jgi:hypothetical protein
MGIFGHSRAWRVVALVCGMVWFGPAADLTAGTLTSPGAMELIRKSAEPFGLFVSKVSAGALREKWLGVERKLDDERVTVSAAYHRRPCNSLPSWTMPEPGTDVPASARSTARSIWRSGR